MAITSGYFNSVNGDRKYNADQMSEYFEGIINEGVCQHIDGGLAVTAGTGLSVNVAAGKAFIGKKWIRNDASLTLTISSASTSYARIDAVVLRRNNTTRTCQIVVKSGTPAASPAAPTMTRNATTYEMALAYVNVAANATSVTVTDKRADSTVCGWATVAQATSGEVDQMLNDMKTGFDGVVYPSPAAMVQGEDEKIWSKSLKEIKTTSAISSLASLLNPGIYNLQGTYTSSTSDLPSGATPGQVGTLIVVPNNYSGKFATQIYQEPTGTSRRNKEWKRTLNSDTGVVFSDWARTDMYTDEAYTAGVSDGNITSFADYLEPGTYGFDRGHFNNMADAPTDAAEDIYNLYVVAKSWSGGRFTVQFLEKFDGKVWERTLTTATKAVLSDWRRIDPMAIITPSSGNVLYGKKLVTAGDSYTEASFSGDYAEYNHKNFGYYIAQRNSMTFVNSGKNGSTMAVSDPENPSAKSPFSYQRYLNVPADTDYLTLWFGINDEAYCQLGTIDDEVNTTFYGAWNIVLRYYLTNRPFMKIGIIITTSTSSGQNYQYQQAVREVAAKWGYPILDWRKNPYLPALFDKEGMSYEAQTLRRDAFGWNGPVPGHPNPECHVYESTIIENFLRSI